MLKRTFAIVLFATFTVSCATQYKSYRAGVACETADFTVTDRFSGARRGRCCVLADDHVRLSILPENDGYINNSPWYAFKVQAPRATTARITLNYSGGQHRYKPKQSRDGLRWRPVDDGAVNISEDQSAAEIVLALDAGVNWVAAQEIVTPQMYDAWIEKMARQSDVDVSVIGQSRAKQAIKLMTSGVDNRDVLLLVGRQHPPEVTGALAFFPFYEALMADSPLAREFRDKIQVVAVPLMNPDGVVGGNWRHNLGGTDLIRDWGPFKQPETQAVAHLLDTLDAREKSLRVFLDFHSTQRNVFYTQDEDNEHTPPRFTRTWLDNARPRIAALDETYEFENKENPTDQAGVSKNYIYHRYGIPASTYELGDETDRVAIRKASVIFAEELMKLMLEQNY